MIVIGRLALYDPTDWAEPMGDAVDMVGGVPVAGASMNGIKIPATLMTLGPSGDSATIRQAQRRALRSILNNKPLREGSLYVFWPTDPEHNGWYVLDSATLKNLGGARYQDFIQELSGIGLSLVGRQRTHRRGVEYIIACRSAATGAPRYIPRDYLQRVGNGDFSTLVIPFALAFTPANPTDVLLPPAAGGFTSQQGTAFAQLDASSCYPVTLSTSQDGGIVHFEQAEADRLKGDVVIRDRRGVTSMASATTGPDPAWVEVYGPDWVSSESDGRFTTDVPVLENGRCRVSYDGSQTFKGFRIDVASAGSWVEQGKVVPNRTNSSLFGDDTLVLAQIMEWTPERGVLKVILRASGDGSSREEVYITLQRGWSGPRFESYPASSATGTTADGGFYYATGPGQDTNDSATWITAAGVATHIATATGAGPNNFATTTIANPLSTGENWIHLLRQGGSFGVTLAFLQAAEFIETVSQASIYSAARNTIRVTKPGSPPYAALGYTSMQVFYYAQQATQIMEAEAMTLGTGTTAAADAGASGSGNNSTSTTRTADAIHVSQATWPGGQLATYRIFARVRTTASTLNIYAKTGATTGATKTTTSTSYVWLDLGEIVANNTTLEIHCWATAAATCWVDRIEAVKSQDRTALSPLFDGARDVGLSHLLDVDPQAAVVPR